jgi:DNA gyrase/topoisomerase IV subunit A
MAQLHHLMHDALSAMLWFQVALVNGVPRTLTLKACLQHFLDFRITTIQLCILHSLRAFKLR